MTRVYSIAVIATSFACVLFAAPAQALVARTFVSAAGSDTNNCANVLTPCRHLAAAYAVTAPNGEIYVLDPANYGSVIITGAVSIEGHGWASIAPVSGNAAITINAQPTDVINIIGVVIDGTALTNTAGIQFNTGATLTVQDSVIRNVTGDGIHFAPTTATSSIAVSNTFIANNGANGILVRPNNGSGTVTGTFDHVKTQYNGSWGISFDGLLTTGTMNGSVNDSVSSGNGSGGYNIDGQGGVNVLTVVRSVASNNHVGVQGAAFLSSLYISASTITNNTTDCNGGVFSYADNIVANTTCTAASATKQ